MKTYILEYRKISTGYHSIIRGMASKWPIGICKGKGLLAHVENIKDLIFKDCLNKNQK